MQSSLEAAWGVLKPLSQVDARAPAEELARYLLVRYADRYDITPRRFEEVVSAVFAGCGYRTRLTAHSRDGGIDIAVFEGTSNDLIGVQVKRHRRKIGVQQIREFGGALVLGDVTRGIFVTTSDFTAGARKAAQAWDKRGCPIELWNAYVFYDRLQIAKRSFYQSMDEPGAPFLRFLNDPAASMKLLWSDMDF
jgi:restriction system protein